ncbi:hypothetical protein [Hymenobacter sp. BT190]|uniref:hypothetical protein n=1 Tax=Hymenobacter sp. BT190 TaxID=2763505 RepID=UPI0016512D35|nr:hypothetical protein [Hymenobacter sp. BT190]MBC6698570.1 hypothetical protein [Hymenobacter sp. BT190]
MARFYSVGLAMVAACLGAVGAACAQTSNFSMYVGAGTVPVRASYVELLEQPTATQARGEYALTTVRSRAVLASLGLAFDAPLWKISADQAVGLSLNVAGGLLGAPREIYGFNGSALLDFPEYVTWRYGCKATHESDSAWGVGVGAGYRYALYSLPFRSPSLMLEGAHTFGRSNMYLRLSADVLPSRLYADYSSEGPVEAIAIRQQLTAVMGLSF